MRGTPAPLTGAALCLWAVLRPAVARADGHEIIEQSPAATGMAGAQTGSADDASAVFYNPGGLLRRGGSVLLGADLAFAQTRARGLDGGPATRTRRQLFPLPAVFAAGRIGNRIAVGLGAFTQLGSGLRWRDPATFGGRFLSTDAQLRTATFSPTLALGDRDAPARREGTTEGAGWNAGALLDVAPGRLAVGLTYRSRVDLDFGLDARLEAPATAVAAGVAAAARKIRLAEGRARAEVPLPHHTALGVAFNPAHGLSLALDLRVTFWSALEELRMDLEPAGTPPTAFPATHARKAAHLVALGASYRP